MGKILKHHTISFQHAFAGIVWAFKTQPNFRVHVVLGLVALSLCRYFDVTATESAIIVFAIVLGLAAEMVNTALESMTDLITREWREEAKIAKDVSAGMMLLVAVGASIVAIYIFTPYVLATVGY